MYAAVLEQFGGPDELILKNIPTPDIGPEEVLIQVDYAGVGAWDIFEREGGYAKIFNKQPKFPYILGSEGAGSVVALGKHVNHLNVGDKVYAPGFLNAKGGFYAEYVAIDSKYVCLIPDNLTVYESSVVSGVGLTALRGLEDILELKPDETIMILGANGGVGHLSVQLAKHMRAQVFAVASGDDGVAMVKNLGIDTVINGRKDDIVSAARSFAPNGLNAALFTVGGKIAQTALQCIRPGGRIAYPNGVYPKPQIPSDIKSAVYSCDPDQDIIHRLNNDITSWHLKPHIDHTFSLKDVRDAHQALEKHYLGKLCLEI